MNEKIGMYTKDKILEYMTDCEGAFLELLIELGYKEVAELFDVISDETPFWYA